MARIAVILVNWNGKKDTISCLSSLLRLNDKDISIIVCDNDSSDDSVSTIVEWGTSNLGGDEVAFVEAGHVGAPSKFLTIAQTGGNLGFAGGNNVGIRMALSDPNVEAVWLLNNDTEVEADTLEAMRHRLAEDTRIGICGSTLVYAHDRSKIQSLGVAFNLMLGYGKHIGEGLPLSSLPGRAEVERKITYISGASMLVTRRFLETVGLMNETFFLYGEELDWSLRNKGRFALAWAPASLVYHKEGASIGTSTVSRPSDLSIYYQNVNILRVSLWYRPWFLPLVLLRVLARGARFAVRGDARGVWTIARVVLDFISGKQRVGASWLRSPKSAVAGE